ncbi:hypothetical protein GCM10010401_08530 [Rarobacter faecitabidus]|uniref:hypothetical protein n=1 Tax=Rarobacter faecitabidus TaxID=13243 RepID=UPI001B86CDE9|nr:hypothetical protein [Rarobacter faecitabidus]
MRVEHGLAEYVHISIPSKCSLKVLLEIAENEFRRRGLDPKLLISLAIQQSEEDSNDEQNLISTLIATFKQL